MFENADVAAGYLAAAIDGEGTVSGHVDRPEIIKQVIIINTDDGLLSACREACDMLGIAYYERKRKRQPNDDHYGRKQITEIVISRRENLEHLMGIVDLRTVKAEKLRAMVDGFRRIKRVSDEELRVLLAEHKSQKKVAAHLGVSQGTVWNWLHTPGGRSDGDGRKRGTKWSDEKRRRRAIGGGG